MGEQEERECDEFINKQFRYWRSQNMPWTYVAPPVFTYTDDFVPVNNASNYIPELYDKIENRHGQKAEEHVLNVFVRFGDYTNQPMFIFANFEIKQLMDTLHKYDLILNKTNILRDKKLHETDLVIVHREIGIILVEVKSNIKTNGNYKKAQKQLNEREEALNKFQLISTLNDFDLLLDISSQIQKYFIRKVIACPYQHECEIEDPKLKNPAEYIDLCKEHMNSLQDFSEWWFLNIINYKLFHDTECKLHSELIYCNLIPKIFHGYIYSAKKFEKLNLNMKDKIHDALVFQTSLSAQLEANISKKKIALKEIQKANSNFTKLASEINEPKLQFSVIESQITEVELCTKNAIKQIKSQVEVAKIIASTDRVVKTDEITGDTPNSVLRIWEHVTLEQSQMWAKEKQIICGPYGSGKTVLIQCKAADLARTGANVLVVLPSHLMMKYEVFFSKHASDIQIKQISEPIKDRVKQTEPERDMKEYFATVVMEHPQESIKHFECNCSAGTLKEPARPDENQCTSDDSKTVIQLVSITIFLKYFESHYKQLAQNSHVFIDEFLWPHFKYMHYEIEKTTKFKLQGELKKEEHVGYGAESINEPRVEDINKFLEFLVQQLSKHVADTTHYLWIAPHSYIILVCLLTDKFQEDEVQRFYLMLDRLDKSITTLNTTMRTTKQINDFITQKQWQDFTKLSKTLNRQLFSNKILKAALCNSHGHHISGPPVRVFCKNFDDFDNFKEFFVEVIDTEADRLTSSTIKLHDIAVIVDAYTKKSSDIKLHLLEHLQHPTVTFTDYYKNKKKKKKKEQDAIVICDSRDIASEEWPVVIHVKYFYDYNDRLQTKGKLGYLTYFESFHNMIASRCTVQYIIICCKGDEDAWPHDKSIKDFRLHNYLPCDRTTKKTMNVK